MRYRDALTYVFRNPKWLPNLLVLAVATLVPLIGPVFAFGYTAAVAESLRGGREEAGYHILDVDRIADYLLRGFRMFLVSILAALVMVPLYFVVVFGTIFTSALTTAAGSQGSETAATFGSAAGCLVVGLGVALLLAVMLALGLLLLPMHLRAGLNPDLAAAFSPRFVRDFLGRMWRETLLCFLVLIVISIPLAIGGLLLLVVGVFVVAAYLHLVQAHLLAQLADLYEARGGESVAGTDSEMPTPLPLTR